MTMRKAGAGVVRGGVALLAVPLTAACTPTQKCGQLGFEYGTEWGAHEIQATNTSCPTARGVASGSKNMKGRNYAGFGWSCVAGAWTTTGYPTKHYRCSGPAGGLVTFDFSG